MGSTPIDYSVQDALDQIIISEGFEADSEIKICDGSEVGEGFASKTYAVTLTDREKCINLFIKYFPSLNGQVPAAIQGIFDNERNFYKAVYPALLKFQSERCVKDGFSNVPKSYHVGQTRGLEPIILENIKFKGYDLHNRKEQIDDVHVAMVLETVAKFHAVSYALKDQDPRAFEQLAFETIEVTTDAIINGGYDEMIESCMRQFLKDLDGECAERLAKTGLCENVINFCRSSCQYLDKYSVVLHGDCWLNNVMFLYKENERKPLDVKLIDWQLVHVNSPVLDVSSFFYTVATKEMMKNLEKYQKIYHDELKASIRKLGSDPEKMFPYDVFKQHWTKYSKFGFAVAFPTIKGMLYDKDEVPDMWEGMEGELQADLFSNTIKNQEEYQARMNDIFEHFTDNNFF